MTKRHVCAKYGDGSLPFRKLCPACQKTARNRESGKRAAVGQVYEQARRHGYGHERALQAVEEGEVRCWCSCPTPCVGGAQRLVGCVLSFTPDHPEGVYACGVIA